MPGGNLFDSRVQFRDGAAVHIKRVGRRELRYGDSDRVLPLELQIGRVALGAKFGAPYILQADQSAVGVGLQNDVVELRRLAQPPDRPHADLVLLSRNRRLLPHLSGCDFPDVLRERAYHIGRRQPAPRHPHWVQP